MNNTMGVSKLLLQHIKHLFAAFLSFLCEIYAHSFFELTNLVAKDLHAFSDKFWQILLRSHAKSRRCKVVDGYNCQLR